MSQRCEHCKHWIDTAFMGQSRSGWGVWYGVCQSDAALAPKARDIDRHSLMLACGAFEPGVHPNSVNAAIAAKKTEATC